jgi:hypothetical protein
VFYTNEKLGENGSLMDCMSMCKFRIVG